MKLLEPLLVGKYEIAQKFGGNANTYYSENGLKGHPGIDFFQGYDRSITASHDALVYSVMNKDNPVLSKYRAVCTIFQDNGKWYELIYGHCNKIYVKPGDVVRAGDLLASIGNTGDVYSKGLPVEEDERDKPPYPGNHLHWQLRELMRVTSTEATGQYITGAASVPYRDSEGYYFLIPNFQNGYRGCVDPLPYLYSLSLIQKISYFIKIVSRLAAVAKGRTS